MYSRGVGVARNDIHHVSKASLLKRCRHAIILFAATRTSRSNLSLSKPVRAGRTLRRTYTRLCFKTRSLLAVRRADLRQRLNRSWTVPIDQRPFRSKTVSVAKMAKSPKDALRKQMKALNHPWTRRSAAHGMCDAAGQGRSHGALRPRKILSAERRPLDSLGSQLHPLEN